MEEDKDPIGLGELFVLAVLLAIVSAAATVIVPKVKEDGRKTLSISNARTLATLMAERAVMRGWPRYDGKAFVLSVVADGVVDPENPENLAVFFSPGDYLYTLDLVDPDRYGEITKAALRRGEDFREMTSYAGRRNADRDFAITPASLRRDVPILCDDDDGPVHHPDGVVMAWTSGRAGFVPWADLEVVPPDDLDNPDPFLGDDAASETLQGLSSE